MDEKPSVLFLIIAGVIGSALLSVLSISGVPAAVLVIPFAIIAAILYDVDAGIAVGFTIALLNGIVIDSLRGWNIVVYAIAAGVTVVALQAAYPNKKPRRAAALVAVLGSLIVVLLHDIVIGENLLFRDALFLGTFAVAAHIIAANVIITLIAYLFWVHGKD